MCSIVRKSGDKDSIIIEKYLRRAGQKLIWHIKGDFKQSEEGIPNFGGLDIQSVMCLQKFCMEKYPIVLGTALAGVAQPGRPAVSSATCWAILCYESHLINLLNARREFLLHLPIKLKPQELEAIFMMMSA